MVPVPAEGVVGAWLRVIDQDVGVAAAAEAAACSTMASCAWSCWC